MIKPIAILALVTMTGSAFAQTPAGWALNWQDEFNQASLDTSRWEALTRQDSYNNEKQYYTPSQVSLTGGNLRITATNQPLGTKQYRSGLVRTWAEQTYGRWEVRASLPATQGMWPAIWILPRNVDWPMGGEIDIMENRGSAPTVVGSAYHFGNSVAAHQYVARDFGYNVNGAPVSFQGSMHTYAVEWDNARIRYLIDDVPHYTFYRNTAPISSSPMSIILNLAVGGDYGGDPNGSTVWPQRFDVDYVRNYVRNSNTRALSNTSFESMTGDDYFTQWDEYSDFANVRVDSVSSNARTGTKAVQMYGRFNGQSNNNSGLFQEVAASPGEVWQVGAWARNRPGDKLTGSNKAAIKIEFINQNGDVIGSAFGMDMVNASTSTVYREGVVRQVAPVGTVFARAVLEMVQVNSAGGAVNFDDAVLRRWTSGSVAGDVNLDGAANGADLDALWHSLSAVNSAAFNYNGDGAVNAADVDALLNSAFHTKRGDVNLNGVIDFDDLLALAQNYGRLETGTWSTGDFNGDMNVSFDDLLSLSQNYGSGAAVFETDWALAQSLVPEPAALAAVLAGLFFIIGRKSDASRRRVAWAGPIRSAEAHRPASDRQ